MSDSALTPETRSDKVWAFLMSWIGRATAVIGLCATLAGGITWFISHHGRHRERMAQMALAQTQADQGDYQSSVETYAAILKADPLNRDALDRQLNTTMLWAENFTVLIPEDQSANDPAGHLLDEIFSILEAGLTRSKGTRAADVQAHLGWAHWLNQHIAAREFGSAAEQNLRAALATDSTNVYANAMLGNWMLQNGGNFSEAVQRLRAAAASNKARPLVRRLQIGGLVSSDRPGTRAELVRVANAMRADGEPLDPHEKRRAFDVCCNVIVTEHAELFESLSAVPSHDAWLTYLWLEPDGSDAAPDPLEALTHDYIQACLLEISGDRPQAITQYRLLQQKLRDQPSTVLKSAVNAALDRLSHL